MSWDDSVREAKIKKKREIQLEKKRKLDNQKFIKRQKEAAKSMHAQSLSFLGEQLNSPTTEPAANTTQPYNGGLQRGASLTGEHHHDIKSMMQKSTGTPRSATDSEESRQGSAQAPKYQNGSSRARLKRGF